MADQPNRGSDLPSDVDYDHPVMQAVQPRPPQNYITTHNRNVPGNQHPPPRRVISIQPLTPVQQTPDPVFSVHPRQSRSEDCVPEKTPYHEYRFEKNRLNTFKTWPANAPVRKEDLARNGFIYMYTNDRVQCVFCRGVLSSWERGDVVEEEHRTHCQECPFAFGYETPNVPMTPRQQSTASRPLPESSSSSYCRPQPVFNTVVKIPVADTARSYSFEGDVIPGETYNRLDSRPLPSLPSGPPSVAPGALVPATNNPKYQAWSDMNTRIKSFSQWPSQMNQKPPRLAHAGLIYLGSGDRCKCFWCGGELYEWEQEDDPWEEHAKWFPHCNYVRNIKGENYVQYVKDKQNGLNVAPPDDGNPHVLSVLQEGFSLAEVDEVFRLYGATRFLDARAIVDAIQKTRKERTAFINQQNNKLQDLVVEDIDIEPISNDERTASHGVQVVSDDVSSPEVTSPRRRDSAPLRNTAANKDVDPVLLENEKLKDQKLCKICLDDELSITFFPCGHLATCEDCSQTMTLCPICRKPIENKHRVFWS